jgi:hypothetical protein
MAPYLKQLLDYTITYPHRYVIFGSRLFQQLFRLNHIHVEFLLEREFPEEKFHGITKNSLAFSNAHLRYKNVRIHAGIAHSLPRRDLPNDLNKMAEWGRMCYSAFQNKCIT